MMTVTGVIGGASRQEQCESINTAIFRVGSGCVPFRAKRTAAQCVEGKVPCCWLAVVSSPDFGRPMMVTFGVEMNGDRLRGQGCFMGEAQSPVSVTLRKQTDQRDMPPPSFILLRWSESGRIVFEGRGAHAGRRLLVYW